MASPDSRTFIAIALTYDGVRSFVKRTSVLDGVDEIWTMQFHIGSRNYCLNDLKGDWLET